MVLGCRYSHHRNHVVHGCRRQQRSDRLDTPTRMFHVEHDKLGSRLASKPGDPAGVEFKNERAERYVPFIDLLFYRISSHWIPNTDVFDARDIVPCEGSSCIPW